MTDIRFYHLQKQTLDQALPMILEKAYQADNRIIVKMSDEKEVERMNDILWTYRPDKFLPHGSKKNGNAPNQPIWLTDKEEKPNGANVIILTQNTTSDTISEYEMCCEMLDGRDENAVIQARQRWKEYQKDGHTVTYWFQSESGKWEKKA